MPVTAYTIERATPQEIQEYARQLLSQRSILSSLDRAFLDTFSTYLSREISQEFLADLRGTVYSYRHALIPIGNGSPLEGSDVVTRGTFNDTRFGRFVYDRTIYGHGASRYIDGNSSNLPRNGSQIEELRQDVLPPPVAHNITRSWELAFSEEEDGDPYDANEGTRVAPYIREEQPVLPREKILTLKEIAGKINPGILGLQLNGDGKPYSLVFRAKNDDDPRKRLLKGFGWFEVKGQENVLWAAATLEAYNTLIDTDMTFQQTAKVEEWWQYINSDASLPGLDYFGEDCPLFEWQRDAVKFLVRRQRGLLALSPGLGKTLTSAYAASLLSDVRTVLLVCPASLLHYWYGELNKWSPFLPLKPMPEIWHKQTGTKPELADLPPGTQFWAITNPETLTRFTDEFILDSKGAQQFWDLLIVDESIMYKHRDSKRSQALNRMAQATSTTWLLSGAPATKFLDDMWHQFHILNNHGYASYWRFAESYCKVLEDEWSKKVIANRRGAEEAIKENFRDVYFARNQDQVANIPDWIFVDMDVAMKPKQEAIYQKLNKELRIKIEGWEDDYVMEVDDRLTLTLRSLQIASNPVLVGSDNSSGKWSALPELMEFYEGPYLVWVNFIRTGEMLKELLTEKFGKGRVELANGSTKMADRQKLVDSFQAGGMDVLILNNQVGKFGFTLTKARTSFFVERGYDDSYFQCLHRNRRIGTTQSPVVVNMRSCTQAGGRTIDHVVHDALDYRNNMIRSITVGDIRKVLEDE